MRNIFFFVIALLCVCSCVQYPGVTSSNITGTWESRDGRFLFLYPDSSLFIKDLPGSSVFCNPDWTRKGTWDTQRWEDSIIHLNLHYRLAECNARFVYDHAVQKCAFCSHELLILIDIDNDGEPLLIHHVSDTVPSDIEAYMKMHKEKGSGFKCLNY